MSIKDLSDVVRLPRLGKFHLGIRHPEKGYPMKTDYFVIPKDHPDYATLVELFGEKPKELRILIPVEDEEQWASQYYKAYNQTFGLVCKGDGETAMRMVDKETGELPNKDKPGTVVLKEIACAGKDCPDYKAKKCKEVMNLLFILPEVPGLGVWQIDTSSVNSIMNINSCAMIIKQAFGRITKVPLKLTLEPVQVNNPTDGKKQTVYVLHLRTDVTLAQLAVAAREQTKTFMLEAPNLEAVYEAEIEKDIDDFWGAEKPIEASPTQEPTEEIPPEEAGPTPETEAKKAGGPETSDATDELLSKIMKTKKYKSFSTARSYLVKSLHIEDKRIDTEPEAVWEEIKEYFA